MVKERPLTNHNTDFEKKPIEDDFNDIATEEEEDPKGAKWKTLFYDFTQNTSMHGISYVTAASRFMARRIAWLLLVATCAGIFMYYAYNRLDYYLQFTKNVNVEVNYLQRIKFPAVTFCNQNAFKITPVANNGWYDLIQNVFNSGSGSAGFRPCLDSEFQCDTKDCISADGRCDLFPDCPDASDELNCKPCPVIYFMGPASAETILPDIVGERFQLQPMTFDSSLPLYMNTDTPTNIYLYHESGEWIFGELYGNGAVKYAKITSSAATPQEITGNWLLRQPDTTYAAEPTMNLSCGVENLHYLDWETSGNFSMLNLSYIYDTASHEKNDFIESCKWKGEDCQEGSITPVLTDMGICYTFFDENNFYIEQAGPGYGLSLKINIEKYEYTKSSADGIGIKLLMHEREETPPVAELGTSVSPGLYSFISVETTEVKNLEPPWGTCGKSELKYYETYSIPNCKMECETDFLESSCDCKDLYMPGEGNPPVCDVNTYVNCAKPNLVEMRAAGNYCTCATPCKQETYVPTTSFSVVLGPESDTGVVDNKTLTLQRRLKIARETTFRVVQSRYTSTLRMFHVFSEQLGQMVRFASSVDLNLMAESESVAKTTSNVFGDCINVREIITGIRDEVIDHIKQPFDEFREAYISSVYQPSLELVNVVNEAKTNYNSLNAGQKTELEAYLTDTTKRLWSTIKEGVDILREEFLSEITGKMDAMYKDDDYKVDAALFTNFEPYVDENCGWCVGSTDPLAETAYDRVRDYMSTSASPQMNNLWLKVDNFYESHIVNNNNGFLNYAAFSNDIYAFGNESYSIRNKADSIRDAMRGKEDDIVECLQFLQEMEYISWRLLCQTEFKKLFTEYEGSENQLAKHLSSFVDYMTFQDDTLKAAADKYILGNMTLEEVAKSFDFDRIITATEQFKTRVETELSNMVLKLESLHRRINNIYYVFMTELKDSYLASDSDYWNQFSITSPSVDVQTTTIGSNNIPNPELTMVPNANALAYWTDLTDNVEDINSKMGAQVSDLLDAINEVKAYFDAYIVGNTLNSDFYGENFLQVELFYKELTERKVSQQKAYDYQNLLSELGGLMGLLLGASCMTVVEIFDLFLYNSCRKCIPPRQRKTMVQPLNTT